MILLLQPILLLLFLLWVLRLLLMLFYLWDRIPFLLISFDTLKHIIILIDPNEYILLFTSYWWLQFLQTSSYAGIFQEGNVRWCLKQIRQKILSVDRRTTWLDYFYPDVVVWHCMYMCHVHIIYSGLNWWCSLNLLHDQIFLHYKGFHYYEIRKPDI